MTDSSLIATGAPVVMLMPGLKDTGDRGSLLPTYHGKITLFSKWTMLIHVHSFSIAIYAKLPEAVLIFFLLYLVDVGC